MGEKLKSKYYMSICICINMIDDCYLVTVMLLTLKCSNDLSLTDSMALPKNTNVPAALIYRISPDAIFSVVR